MPDFHKAPRKDTQKPKASSDLITVPQCHVCKSRHRKTIEKMLALGTSYSEIERAFDIDRRSISNHNKEHLNLESAAIRRIVEEEAQDAEANLEEGVKGVLARRVYLSTALHKAFEGLVNGEIPVEPKDALAIIDKLDSLDEQGRDAGMEELRLQFQAYLQAMKEIVPSDQWERILKRTQELTALSSAERQLGP